jgi:peptide deformylase
MEPCTTVRGGYEPVYREEVIKFRAFDTKDDKHNYYFGNSEQQCALFLKHSTSEARSVCFIRCMEQKVFY